MIEAWQSIFIIVLARRHSAQRSSYRVSDCRSEGRGFDPITIDPMGRGQLISAKIMKL